MTLAARHGAYETFKGSPASEGILQFDMWGVDPMAETYPAPKYRNKQYDWNALKDKIQKHGLRNSLLLAPMPTASTSQILGNNECFEPITSNIYTRRTLAGEFIMVNRYLIRDLIALGIWNERVKTNIIANQGSVQYIDGLSDELKLKYKTVWEMPMRHIIDMAADRGAFICQSQSMNLWVEEPNYNILTSMLFYAWNKGLKTGVYYLRRKAKHQAQQFTVEPEKAGAAGAGAATEMAEDDICEFCSS
jgi:ribonucleotide reductase alpha subunit